MAADEPRSDNPRVARFARRPVSEPSGLGINLQEAAAAMASAARLRASRKGYEFMDAPLVGLFVFTHGRWSDLATTFGHSYQEELLGWSERDPFYPVTPVNTFLGTPLAQLIEVAEASLPPQLVGGAELFALGARLANVEKQVEQLASTVAGTKEQPVSANKETSKRGGAEPGHAEKLEVKPAVVDTNAIASCVRSFAVAKSPTWNVLSKHHPGVKLFAIDADPRSFQVSEKGEFDGRANLLVSVPRTLRSGRTGTHSLTIPTRVFGKLSPAGEIEVAEFKLS